MSSGEIFHYAFTFGEARPDNQRDVPAFVTLLPLFSKWFSVSDIETFVNCPDYTYNLNRVIENDGILVFTTRLPMDDDPEFDRRTVFRSYSETENRIFNVFRPIFKTLSRPVIELQPEITRHLPFKYRDFAAVRFRVHRSGDIYSMNRRDYFRPKDKVPDGYNRSLGYLVLIQPVKDMPRILAAFSPSGLYTYYFVRLLRWGGLWTALNLDLRKDSRFIMVSFSTKFDKRNLILPAFDSDIDYELILDVSIDTLLAK